MNGVKPPSTSTAPNLLESQKKSDVDSIMQVWTRAYRATDDMLVLVFDLKYNTEQNTCVIVELL